MATIAITLVSSAFAGGTFATFWIVISAAIDITYGTRFVTTARSTIFWNWLLSSGLIVISASATCATSRITIPTIGVPVRVARANTGRK